MWLLLLQLLLWADRSCWRAAARQPAARAGAAAARDAVSVFIPSASLRQTEESLVLRGGLAAVTVAAAAAAGDHVRHGQLPSHPQPPQYCAAA